MVSFGNKSKKDNKTAAVVQPIGRSTRQEGIGGMNNERMIAASNIRGGGPAIRCAPRGVRHHIFDMASIFYYMICMCGQEIHTRGTYDFIIPNLGIKRAAVQHRIES